MFKRLIIAAIIGALCGAPVRASLLLTGVGGIGGSGPTAAQVSNFLTQSYTGSCTTFAGCYTFSRAGNAMDYDSTGTLTYAPNNQLLNSATLSTQSITTTPSNYVLSIYGTGSVVLSGTKVATLSGTGASNQVYLAFTATAGTLTLTVAGSVTSAVLANVTYETAPRPGDQVITTSAAYYGPRFDYPNSTAAGLLLESKAATNVLQNSNAFTTSPWATVGSDVTTGSAGTSPDGTNDAWKISTTLANAAYGRYQPFTYTSAVYTLSAYAKVGTYGYLTLNFSNTAGVDCAVFNLNTGAVGFSASGVTANILPVGNGWYRLSVTATQSAGASYPEVYLSGSGTTDIRFWVAAGTENLLVFGAQLELGSIPSSYIYTQAASVTRPAESLTATPSALGWSDTTGTLIVEGTFPPANQLGVIANVQGASLELELQESNAANNAAGQYEGAYASSSTNWVYDSTTNLPAGSPVRAGVQIISGTDYLSANGNALITGSTVGSLSSTSINFGQRNGGTNQLAQLHLRSLGVYNTAMSSVAFRAKTTVGASY